MFSAFDASTKGGTLARIRDKTCRPRRVRSIAWNSVAAVSGAVVAATAWAAATGDAAGGHGQLVVREKVVDKFGVYEEGARSYLRVRRVADGKTVVRRKYRGVRIRHAERLPARRYRIISFVRPCSGSCQRLDAPADRCSAEFRLPRKSELTAKIITNDGSPCQIKFTESR